MAVLGRLIDDMKAQTSDHVAMTGDILNLGLAAEFPYAATWLRSLGDPRDVSFVPGNHDAYVRSSVGNIARTFLPWLADATPGATATPPAFPYVRRRGDVALIGLSSAVPTAPFLASGSLGSTQRAALGPMLDAAAKEGLARVILIHHPPYKEGASTGRGLRDARAFAAVIAAHGAELILHGHNHRAMLAHLPGPQGLVPIVGVPSASAIPGSPNHRAAYHLFRIERDGAGWSLLGSRRGLPHDLGPIADLGTFDLGRGGIAAVSIDRL
jgi:3',5'-cyclic AMP phosphodiesterase CpdA